MVGLVILITMMSGILVHLQGKTVDYDAVAYRTGVILVEDPGYWEIGESDIENNTWYWRQGKGTNWEDLFSSDPAKNAELKPYVRRIGLENDKLVPGVLSRKKIDAFTDMILFPGETDLSERLFFSDYPYRYAVRIGDMDGNTIGWSSNAVSDASQIPANTGYIRRIVHVKEVSTGTLDVYADDPAVGIGTTASRHSVVINFNDLYNQTIGPNYWINPQSDEMTILVSSHSGTFSLEKIGLFRSDPVNTSQNIPDTIYQKNLSYSYAGANKTVLNNESLPGGPINIAPGNPLTMYFPGGIFNPSTYDPESHRETLTLYFQGNPDAESSQEVSYENPDFTPSGNHEGAGLVPAALEVWIW